MRKSYALSAFTRQQEHVRRFERNELRDDSKLILSRLNAQQNWTIENAAGSDGVQAAEAARLWVGIQVWQAPWFQQWSSGSELPQLVEFDDQPRVRPARSLIA